MTAPAPRDRLKRLADRIENLPTLPTVVSSLLQTVNDPRASASDVQRFLQYDQSMTMKVLRLANSSFYGCGGQIKTLSHAVVVLGFNTIRSIALSASIFDAFGGKGSREFRRDEFWRHAIAVGVAARLFATRLRWDDVEEAFLAGIVHDIGKVVLDQHAHREFAAAIAHAREKGLSILEAETAIVGAPHTMVGRWVGTRWNLPPGHLDAISGHHDPARAENAPRIAAAVHLADVVARACRIGWAGDDLVPPLDGAAVEILGIGDAEVKDVIARLPEEFAKAEHFVRLAGAKP